jgi:hypothetical protein
VKKLVLHGLFHQILRINIRSRPDTRRGTAVLDKRKILCEWLWEYFSLTSSHCGMQQDVPELHDPQLATASCISYSCSDPTASASRARHFPAQSAAEVQDACGQQLERVGVQDAHSVGLYKPWTMYAEMCSRREAETHAAGQGHSPELYAPLNLNHSANVEMCLPAQPFGAGLQESWRRQHLQIPYAQWTLACSSALALAEQGTRSEQRSQERYALPAFDYLETRCSSSGTSGSGVQDDRDSPPACSSGEFSDSITRGFPAQPLPQQQAVKRRRTALHFNPTYSVEQVHMAGLAPLSLNGPSW